MSRILLTVVSWIARIGLFGVVAYLLHPLFYHEPATLPASADSSDSISWKFHDDSEPNVFQELTIFRDGRSRGKIIRPTRDRDIPSDGGWLPHMDAAKQWVIFEKEGLMPRQEGRELFNELFENGVLDLRSEPSAPPSQFEVEVVCENKTRLFSAPMDIQPTPDWNPEVWKNRLRWRKLVDVIESAQNLRHTVLNRKTIVLVDE